MLDSLAQFHFIRPWWLLALLPAGLLLWAVGWREDVRKRWRQNIAPHLLDALVVDRRGRWHLRPVHLTSALMALGALAMAGPTWERERPPFLEEKAPLAIAIDLGVTMDAMDVSPTRLERAKLKVKSLLALRQGARTAIYAYAGSTHLVLPLTDDGRLIQTFVDALQTSIMPKPGKNTALALRTIDADMAKEDTPGTIVFFTDGVEPGATEAFKAQVDSGRSLPVVLGFGTEQGGPLKTPDDEAPGSAGRPSSARLDVQALKRLGSDADVPVATVTLDGDDDVAWVQHRVQSHLAQKESESNARWKEAGWWLVLPITLLSALWFRQGWTVRWLGTWVFAALLAATGVPRGAAAQLVESTADEQQAADAPAPSHHKRFIDWWLTPDQQGRLAFEDEDYAKAAGLFTDPMWRGVALYRAGRFDAAQQAFALVDSPESLFNQGNSLAQRRRYEAAIAFYTQALQRRPDWKEAKANLALMKALIARQHKDGEEEAPDLQPDKIEFDKTKEQGGKQVQLTAAQNAEAWMRNIQTSPTAMLARKFALQVQQPARPASPAQPVAGQQGAKP
ncbi:MAG: VWA domain-containing protein [Proteobacteria bacterium]|nr:VWA domain-containing protein [Pseudomonadota bacterium]